MDINLTLVIQMLVFIVFVLFTMRFVWPPLSKALEERKDKIADGLAAAERGHRELELTQARVKQDLKHSKVQAGEVLEKANRRAMQMLEEAKEAAKQETLKQAKLAKEQIAHEVSRAKDALRLELASLAMAGAEKILKVEIDPTRNKALLDQLIEEI